MLQMQMIGQADQHEIEGAVREQRLCVGIGTAGRNIRFGKDGKADRLRIGITARSKSQPTSAQAFSTWAMRWPRPMTPRRRVGMQVVRICATTKCSAIFDAPSPGTAQIYGAAPCIPSPLEGDGDATQALPVCSGAGGGAVEN